MRRFLLSAFFVCFCSFAFGQKNVRPGYIVTLQGDTLRGQVQDLSEARNSLSVSFQEATSANWKEFKPEELKSFGVADQKKYVSQKVVKVAPRPEGGADSTWHIVFLQELVKGPISLYFLKTASAHDRFFLRRGENTFTEIEKRRQLVKIKNATYMKTLNFYQDSLKAIFASCPELAAKASKTQYTVKQMSKAFIAYNMCAHPQTQTFVSETTTKKTVAVPSVTIGYGTGNIHVTEEGETFFNEPTGTSSLSGGVAVNIFNATVSKKFSLQIGVDYSKKGASATYTVKSSGVERQMPTTISLECLDFSILMKYNTKIGPVQPFIGAGPMVGYLINHGATYNQGGYYLDSPINKTEYGVAAETGFLLPVFSNNGLLFSLRYEGARINYNFLSRGEYYSHFFRVGVGYWFSSSGK